jgi:hypothetical protein
VHLLVLGLLAATAAAVPHRSAPPRVRAEVSGTTIPLVRRAPETHSPEALVQWAHDNRLALESKYGSPAAQKRAKGTN